jgi:hypothetical protein
MNLSNPQSLNRYSYTLNNPLKYNDPTGHWPEWLDKAVADTTNWAKWQWYNTETAIKDLWVDIQPAVEIAMWGAMIYYGIISPSISVIQNRAPEVINSVEKITTTENRVATVAKGAAVTEQNAASSANSNLRVIGRFVDEYIGQAQKLGAEYFNVADDLPLDTIKQMNMDWIDQGASRGAWYKLVSSYDSLPPTSATFAEVNRLINMGLSICNK